MCFEDKAMFYESELTESRRKQEKEKGEAKPLCMSYGVSRIFYMFLF